MASGDNGVTGLGPAVIADLLGMMG